MIGSWMLFSLLITSAYGGILAAHLSRPSVAAPIDSMGEIVSSGLPWHIVLYGDEVGTVLSESEDPVERAFWRDKTPAPFEVFPVDEVGN